MNPQVPKQPKIPVITPPQPMPNRKPAKWLLSCIIILVIGVGSALLIKNQMQQGAHASHTTVIRESAMTFTPSKVVISQGDSITWINDDSQAHDVHTNTDTISLGANEQRTITYNAKGTFTYIDTMNPNLQAIIVVQ